MIQIVLILPRNGYGGQNQRRQISLAERDITLFRRRNSLGAVLERGQMLEVVV